MIKKWIFILELISILTVFSITLHLPQQQSDTGNKKIIIFKKDVSNQEKENILNKYNIVKEKDLSLINGIASNLTYSQVRAILQEEKIERIEHDTDVKSSAENPQSYTDSLKDENVTWGLDRVDALSSFLITKGENVNIAIMDTGIDLSHTDLKNNIKGGFNAINSKKSYDDDNGHGTMLAGIIAAEMNDSGVLGVAPKSNIYAIKVLGSNGLGSLSNIIKGLKWAIDNKMDVVNLSLSIETDSKALHEAIIKAVDANITIVASAGNQFGKSVGYPANYKEVISVSAINSKNQIPIFCPKGKIDIVAPGSDIYSTFRGSKYRVMSGTSLASAYVTGVVALLLVVPEQCDFNQDGKSTPTEIKNRLESTAINLGDTSKYGFGLVNAYNAVTFPIKK